MCTINFQRENCFESVLNNVYNMVFTNFKMQCMKNRRMLHTLNLEVLFSSLFSFRNLIHCHGFSYHLYVQFSSVQFICSVVSNSLRLHGLQHAMPPCPSPTPGVNSNSYPLVWWCHLTISFPVVPFSSHLQSFPASGSFPLSPFFASGGQRIGVSTSASVLPMRSFQMSQIFISGGQRIEVSTLASIFSMNIQDWFPLGWTGSFWISLQSKWLSKVLSNITDQKHQFFGAQLSL